MANPVVYPANLQWLGIGKEAVAYGTAATVPAYWIPIVDPKWKPNQSMLKDDALRGDMATTHQQVAGNRYDTLDFKSYLYLDSLYLTMLNILGNTDTVTGASDPYTHKTSLKNTGNGQPTSYTLWLSTGGAECWQMTGCQLATAEVDIPAEDMASQQVQWVGLPATVVTPPSNTPSTAKPWAGWNTVIKLATVAASTYSSAKITMKRPTVPIFTADGNQAPYMIFAGPLDVTGELVAVYQGLAVAPTDLANYIANTQPALTIQISPVGDVTHNGIWQFSVVGYDSVEVSGSAGKWMEVTAQFEALANSTDALGGGQSPVMYQQKDAVATY